MVLLLSRRDVPCFFFMALFWALTDNGLGRRGSGGARRVVVVDAFVTTNPPSSGTPTPFRRNGALTTTYFVIKSSALSMFTGIVEEMGMVVSLKERNDMTLWDGSTGTGTELTVQGKVVMEGAYLG